MSRQQLDNANISGIASYLKRSFHEEGLSSSNRTTVLPLNEKKRKLDAIIQRLNVVTNSQSDSVPAAKLHKIYDQKTSLNELSFLENVFNNGGSTANSVQAPSNVIRTNLANTLINQEEVLKKALASQENQLKVHTQNLECYKRIYEELTFERLMRSTSQGGTYQHSLPELSARNRYVNLIVKEAIYVLDPKFMNVMGTYLRIYSETQTKTTKLASDYLKPSWNENIHLKIGQESARVFLEFVLVEKDEYIKSRDEVFGKGSFIIEEAKAENTQVLGWHPIYDIYNTNVEIGKVNLSFEVLPSDLGGLDQLIQVKNKEVETLQNNIANIKDELLQMENLFCSFTLPNEEGAHSNSRPPTTYSHFDVQPEQNENVLLDLFSENKNKDERIRNYFMFALMILSLLNCFFRPDFLALVLGLVCFFHVRDEWTSNFYFKVRVTLVIAILSDLIWLCERYLFARKYHTEGQIHFLGFSASLVLLELGVKVGYLINVSNLAKSKRERSSSSESGSER